MMKDLDCDMCVSELKIFNVVVFLVFGINKTTKTKNNSKIFKVAIDLSRS